MSIDTNAAPSEKAKILVIDDSRLVRVSIKKVINAEFEVMEAGDGEEGWEILNANRDIRVVVTDAGMPKLDGYGLIKRIRECDVKDINTVPIIMVTGAEAGETKVRDKALALGATDFVVKPFDKPQMLARVRAHSKHDITQHALHKTEVALSEQSIIDPLTKVNNKKYFLQRGEQQLAFANRHKQELSFIAVSIDNLAGKTIVSGDNVTNKMLQKVANDIKNTLRTEDTVARVGGNVFAILAPTAGRMAAAVLCERIRKDIIASPFTQTIQPINITVSLGLACLGKDEAKDISGFLNLILQRAKQAQLRGGNQTCAQSKKPEPAEKTVKSVNVSLDKVVEALNKEDADISLADLEAVANKLFTVLAHCNQKLQWKLDAEMAAIKRQIK